MPNLFSMRWTLKQVSLSAVRSGRVIPRRLPYISTSMSRKVTQFLHVPWWLRFLAVLLWQAVVILLICRNIATVWHNMGMRQPLSITVCCRFGTLIKPHWFVMPTWRLKMSVLRFGFSNIIALNTGLTRNRSFCSAIRQVRLQSCVNFSWTRMSVLRRPLRNLI